MTYLIFLGVFSLLGVVTFLPAFTRLVKRHPTAINFYLTLLATLIGVLLAIVISNYEAKQNEKQDVIKLLTSAISSVEQCHQYSVQIVHYYESLPPNEYDRDAFFQQNIPPYPAYLDIFLAQNIVSTNLSGTTLNDLNEYLINIKRTQKYNVNLYIDMLTQVKQLLSLEIMYQQGALDNLGLQARADALKDQLQLKVNAALTETQPVNTQ